MHPRSVRSSLAALVTLSILWSAHPASADPFKVTPFLPAAPSDMARLPAGVQARGKLTAATTDANKPWSFLDPGTGAPAGVDIDLVNEAARRLKLTVEWSAVQFPAGIPGVNSGRFDLYVSAMADTAAREQVVDFIAYSTEGSGVIVQKGNPHGVRTMEDLCGKRVSIVSGSMFPSILTKLNASCPTPIVVTETADQSGPYLAVASGQADATMNTYSVSNYLFRTATEGIQTRLELSPVPRFAPANQGIAFAKSQAELLAAVAGAMQAMVEDGTYKAIMEKWSVGGGALDKILINAALF